MRKIGGIPPKIAILSQAGFGCLSVRSGNRTSRGPPACRDAHDEAPGPRDVVQAVPVDDTEEGAPKQAGPAGPTARSGDEGDPGNPLRPGLRRGPARRGPQP